MEEQFTRYEKARIIGARALQIAMNAPILVKLDKDELEKIKYDALRIAEIELNSGILPISVKRPMPEKKEERLRRLREKKISDENVEERESKEEEEIVKEGEIMELANPDDEDDNLDGNEESGEE